jgi:hypothetical protein
MLIRWRRGGGAGKDARRIPSQLTKRTGTIEDGTIVQQELGWAEVRGRMNWASRLISVK